MAKRDRKYSGNVGEHYVLYKLIREGFNAVLAVPNTDKVDIYVADKTGKPFAIQVKAKTDSSVWRLTSKHEQIQDERLFYAFVDLGENLDKDPPDTFIVPSALVAKAVEYSHQAWLRTPAKNKKPKKDGDMRDIAPRYPESRYGKMDEFPDGWMEPYRENWSSFTENNGDGFLL